MDRMGRIILIVVAAAGCASNVVDTDLLISGTLLLPPSPPRTAYIQNRNASDNQQVTLTDLASRLTAKGYRVVNDPEAAQYVVLTNIVYCNESRPELPVEAIVASGYGSGIGSVMSGLSGVLSVAGSVAGMHPAGGAGLAIGQMAIGGISSVVGGLSGTFSSSGGRGQPKASSETIYACVADVQITDRSGAVSPSAAAVPPRPGGAPLPPGVYQTRLGASVQQKKLDLDQATPLVRERLSAAVAGHF